MMIRLVAVAAALVTPAAPLTVPAAEPGIQSPSAMPPQLRPTVSGPITIPALTAVEISIEADLGSKTSKVGETFPIVLRRALAVGDRILVPAGSTGQGEVVWAKRSGMGGSAGELVLAARFLDVGGRRLKLRSLNLAPVGRDRIRDVNNLMLATNSVAAPLALVGFFIKGGQSVVPQGTVAMAKTAEDFEIETIAR